MTKTPDDIPKDSAPAPSGKISPVKPKPDPRPPVTKAERAARMRVDKMVIKRMRKR
jgi:hypothetical protein